MGTDQFGRDLFSRIVFGARTALIVSFSCAILGGITGLVLGVASAYFGSRLDLFLQRVFDVVMAFPLISTLNGGDPRGVPTTRKLSSRRPPGAS